jgi:hypothetical protein
MLSTELIELMEEIRAKGIPDEKVEEQTKVSYDLLKLYANSGPVPINIIKNLKKLLEGEGEQRS